MGFLDKAKATAGQAAQMAKEGAEAAAAKAKETADDVKTKRELGDVYGELGRTARELVESGAIAHEKLAPLVEKAQALEAKLADETPAAGSADAPAEEATEPPAAG